ncbi:hypothetical protein A3X92_04620, partial [Salmonella enterica subsp. enterica serovar Hadar]|nr:hypothetical protein [Salmonella enterica]ECS2797568.1 hypothetical protein [Salmonella enterica subsp. enterica serovar Hadar]
SISRYLIQLTSLFRLIAPIMRVRRDTFIQIIPKLTVYLSINLSSFYGILEIFFQRILNRRGEFPLHCHLYSY